MICGAWSRPLPVSRQTNGRAPGARFLILSIVSRDAIIFCGIIGNLQKTIANGLLGPSGSSARSEGQHLLVLRLRVLGGAGQSPPSKTRMFCTADTVLPPHVFETACFDRLPSVRDKAGQSPPWTRMFCTDAAAVLPHHAFAAAAKGVRQRTLRFVMRLDSHRG